MKWGNWSTTAASNSNTPPDGWPEGQAPSTVNDCAREMMAQIATGLQDLQFIDLGLAPTQTGNTTFTVVGNQATALHYGRRIKASDGANTIYGTIISASFTANTGVTLRLDKGNGPFLDASLSAFAVGFPTQVNTAIPENVYRGQNQLRNSQMDIWQRGAGPFSFSSGAVNAVTADCWRFFHGVVSAGCTTAVTRNELSAAASNVPTLAQTGVFLNNSICISVNAAVTSLANGDFIALVQRIEGYNYRQLAGKPITFSFWVNSGVTGTYCVALGNTINQSVVLEYSISAISTWEKKILTFPKSPTAGTWDYSSGVGLQVSFTLAAGSTNQAGAGNWTAVNAIATSNQVNFVANANKAIKFTGFNMNEGTQALPLSTIDYQIDLANCKRYVQPFNGRLLGHAFTNASAVFDAEFRPSMRGGPSLSVLIALTQLAVTTGGGAITSVSAVAIVAGTTFFDRAAFTVNPVGTPFTAGQGSQFLASAGVTSNFILFKAEL